MLLKGNDMFVAASGAFRSSDHGDNWELLNMPNIGHAFSIKEFVVNPDGAIIAGAAGSWGGIFKSEDNGTTWSRKIAGLINIDVLCLAITPAGIFTGTSGGGICFSDDGGENWEARNTGLPETPIVLDLGFHPGANAILAITGNPVDRSMTIFRSANDGLTWTQVFALSEAFSGSQEQQCLAIDAAGKFYFLVSNKGIYTSTDAGLTWVTMDTTGLHLAADSIAVNPWNGDIYVLGTGLWRYKFGFGWHSLMNFPFPYLQSPTRIIFPPNEILVGYSFGGGIYRSRDDGASWVETSKGFLGQIIDDLAISSVDHMFAATGYGGIFRSVDYGKTWTRLEAGPPPGAAYHLAINPLNGMVFAGTQYYGIWRSADNGDHWQTVFQGPQGSEIAVACDPNNGNVYAGIHGYGDGLGVIRSSDNFETWDQSYPDPENPNLLIVSLAVDDNGSIYAGTRESGVFRSDDQGATWAKKNSGLVFGEGILCFGVSSKGYIYAGTWGAGVFRSSDGGENWVHLESSPAHNNCLAVNLEGHIFNGYYLGHSSDDGLTWQYDNSGLGNWGANAFVFDHGGYVYAGTPGRSVYRSAESTLSDPITLIDGLINLIESMNIKQGINNSLDAKLENAKKALDSAEDGFRIDAINKLQAFLNECLAQRGKALTEAQADQLIDRARIVISVLQSR